MIDLFTAATPQGWMVSIALEELGMPYRVHPVNLAADEQKQPWLLKINPNGRIPAIVDRGHDDFAVFESAAILLYLAERAGRLMPKDARDRWRVIQWLVLQSAGLGPTLSEARHFRSQAPTPQTYAIERFQRESTRLVEVLEQRLQASEYLGGHDYSIADIAHWCACQGAADGGVPLAAYPALCRWAERIAQRPAVQRGRQVPAA